MGSFFGSPGQNPYLISSIPGLNPSVSYLYLIVVAGTNRFISYNLKKIHPKKKADAFLHRPF
ncbi:MAG: hypothetical protein CMH78_04865 [Nitrospinae bacterium]|nr:hypothetical protein [Nitrospinota bacterium]